MSEERVALVTGASRGIGRAIARRLCGQGMRMGLLARGRDALQDVADELAAAGGEGLVLPADVADPPTVGTAVERLMDRWGRLDVLVNNAGLGERAPLERVTDDSLHRQFAVNVFGALYCARAAVPHMRRQGHGQIVNIGSMAGLVGIADMSVYAATKWALRGLTQSWREELYPQGIKVAYVAPGYVVTDFGSAQPPEAEWALSPEDVADVVASIVNQGPNADIREVVLEVQDRS